MPVNPWYGGVQPCFPAFVCPGCMTRLALRLNFWDQGASPPGLICRVYCAGSALATGGTHGCFTVFWAARVLLCSWGPQMCFWNEASQRAGHASFSFFSFILFLFLLFNYKMIPPSADLDLARLLLQNIFTELTVNISIVPLIGENIFHALCESILLCCMILIFPLLVPFEIHTIRLCNYAK